MDETLVFKNIILNEGNAYSSKTGMFTAPYSGLYLFTVQIGIGDDGGRIVCSIMVEDKEFGRVNLCSLESRSPYRRLTREYYYYSGSSDAVAKVSKGDQVYVKTIERTSSIYQNDEIMVSFSGVLLKVSEE